jgi:roadblock/LC7 domain-containing protein
MKSGLKFTGKFKATCFDKDGNFKWEVESHNLVVNEGLDHALDSIFHNDTVATWYVAIYEDNYTPAAGDTYAVPGYTECTAYSQGTRPEFVEAAASGQLLSNSANRAVFSITASKWIYGASLVSVSTKGDTAGGGVLWCASLFTNAKKVDNGDTLEVTYTLSSADDGV